MKLKYKLPKAMMMLQLEVTVSRCATEMHNAFQCFNKLKDVQYKNVFLNDFNNYSENK